MSVAAFVSALVLGFGTPHPVQTQDGTALPDVQVTGRPTAEAVREFVGRIAAPSLGRGLAQWRGSVCPGVVNLDPAVAQPIVDRIADVATSVGVEVGAPGCSANLVILFTDDGSGLARAMVAEDESLFRRNVTGLDRGAAAFRDFQTAERPVRWWSLSVPIDSDTGQRAVRVPGERTGAVVDQQTALALGCDSADDCAIGAAPIIQIIGASRLRTQIVDSLYKTIVIVDIDAIGEVNAAQLGDYLAFIGLAQVDGQADTAGFDTVLNLFEGGARDGLTEWDRSYLQALYGPRYERLSPGAQATAVANIMTRDRISQARGAE